MPGDEPTIEEVKQQLRDLGIPVDSWEETTEGTVKSPFLDRQVEMLTKVRDLLEMQVEQDIATVAELTEKVNRLKHGGGS